jgi:class 3 adenylate cyclase
MPEKRRLITILFADTIGSTTLGETLDPEDVRALMALYYFHARRLITAHGGTLEKFIGDAVMAVFGLPQAHGDDAERALGSRFLLHLGVNTGEVVATTDPTGGDFLVTGDAVNVAARLYDAHRG